ncbi:hypothetical protein V1478_011882 [Vespula squamosa]|uniref:Ribosomal protein S10 n=1 Tax=Vespula squamosa TaxID=30214 RepID=A0ABD2ABQ8_VESSQ
MTLKPIANLRLNQLQSIDLSGNAKFEFQFGESILPKSYVSEVLRDERMSVVVALRISRLTHQRRNADYLFASTVSLIRHSLEKVEIRKNIKERKGTADRNNAKGHETKRNETERNETKRNETKRLSLVSHWPSGETLFVVAPCLRMGGPHEEIRFPIYLHLSRRKFFEKFIKLEMPNLRIEQSREYVASVGPKIVVTL